MKIEWFSFGLFDCVKTSWLIPGQTSWLCELTGYEVAPLDNVRNSSTWHNTGEIHWTNRQWKLLWSHMCHMWQPLLGCTVHGGHSTALGLRCMGQPLWDPPLDPARCWHMLEWVLCVVWSQSRHYVQRVGPSDMPHMLPMNQLPDPQKALGGWMIGHRELDMSHGPYLWHPCIRGYIPHWASEISMKEVLNTRAVSLLSKLSNLMLNWLGQWREAPCLEWLQNIRKGSHSAYERAEHIRRPALSLTVW